MTSKDKELSTRDILAATLLFYFRSGMDAKTALDEAPGAVNIRPPTDVDIRTVRNTTPIALWEGVYSVADEIVSNIIEREPRSPLTVAREASQLLRKGKGMLDAFTGGALTPADIINAGMPSRKR